MKHPLFHPLLPPQIYNLDLDPHSHRERHVPDTLILGRIMTRICTKKTKSRENEKPAHHRTY